MREIKFRAMWEDLNDSEGDTWCDTDQIEMSEFFQLLEDGKLDKNTLGQYTGLKDKNGVEIYEGGILKVGFEPYTDEDEDGNDIDTYAETWNTKVSWSSDGGYVLNAPVGHDFWGEYNSTLIGWAVGDGEYELEVIGNIYENSELLGSK